MFILTEGTQMTHDDQHPGHATPLEEAAAQGPLPGIAEEDDLQERGEDDSRSPDEEAIEHDNLGSFIKKLDDE
jgi:hypothetical protein